MRVEHPMVYEQIAEAIQLDTLSDGQSRLLAWSLLMGICNENVEFCYRDLYTGYLSDAFNLEKSTMDDIKV